MIILFHFKNKEIKDLFQWSKDIVLKFDQIYAGEEAHFSNNKTNSLNKKINENGEVTIPNILLTESTPIEVYLFIIDEQEQYTKKKKILPVIARPKPEDYIYTEEENKIWDNKVDIFQGEENSRKILSTDENGKVVTKISTDEIITNKDIPLPTSEDSGKYLGCENGAAAWMPVEASGGGDKWELINEFTIPEGAEEANVLSFTKDSNGNDFSLKKALLLARFPPYTGESTIPNFSFASINGIILVSEGSPLGYTDVWPKLSKTGGIGTAYFVDVSGIFRREKSLITDGGELKNGERTFRNINIKNNIDKEWMAIPNVVGEIHEIGGRGMLVYPGCWFALYGVRA